MMIIVLVSQGLTWNMTMSLYSRIHVVVFARISSSNISNEESKIRGLWWILNFWSLHLKYPISWLARAQSENCVGLCVIEFCILYNLDYGCITLRYDQLVIHPWPCLCPCSCYHAWFCMNVRCWGSLTTIYLSYPSMIVAQGGLEIIAKIIDHQRDHSIRPL